MFTTTDLNGRDDICVMSHFVATPEELAQLAKFWMTRAISIQWYRFIWDNYDSTEYKMEQDALNRVHTIGKLLSEEESQRVIDEAYADFSSRVDPHAWGVFQHGSEEQIAEFQGVTDGDRVSPELSTETYYEGQDWWRDTIWNVLRGAIWEKPISSGEIGAVVGMTSEQVWGYVISFLQDKWKVCFSPIAPITDPTIDRDFWLPQYSEEWEEFQTELREKVRPVFVLEHTLRTTLEVEYATKR